MILNLSFKKQNENVGIKVAEIRKYKEGDFRGGGHLKSKLFLYRYFFKEAKDCIFIQKEVLCSVTTVRISGTDHRNRYEQGQQTEVLELRGTPSGHLRRSTNRPQACSSEEHQPNT
jgi:hypothetical protein